jgi:hypothetical protein
MKPVNNIIVALASIALLATPAFAQGHSGHGQRGAPAGRPSSGHGTVGTAAPRTGAPVHSAPGVVRGVPYGVYAPYYTFRPRVSIGAGLWLGYPVIYPDYYFDSPYPYYPYYSSPYYYGYPYGPTYPYGYDPYPKATPGYPTLPPAPGYGSIGMSPGLVGGPQLNVLAGGLSFDVQPCSAQVYVDGSNVGLVSTFTSTSKPLSVSAGKHHIELKASGYQTMAFDADVTAGQVTPYQGTMQPEP